MSIWKVRKSYLLSELKPVLRDLGFEAVGTTKAGSLTTATHVEFEKSQKDYFDNITIIFDKYWRPKFQITFRRREINAPHKIIKSGHLVLRKGQVTSWFGVRWYSINKENSWKRSIRRVKAQLGQIDAFLTNDVIGNNITDMAKYF